MTDTLIPIPDLPSWLSPIEGAPGHYIADPDLFYPRILEHLDIAAEDATRYDMEAVLGLMKKLAFWYARQSTFGPMRKLYIRGDEGRKIRWAIAQFPVGKKPDISAPQQARERDRAVTSLWRRIMGPIVGR